MVLCSVGSSWNQVSVNAGESGILHSPARTRTSSWTPIRSLRSSSCSTISLFCRQEEADNNSAQPEKAVTYCSQFHNRWLWLAVNEWGEAPAAALQAMAKATRALSFRERASAGPDWESIWETFQGSLDPDHLQLTNSIVSKGGDPIFLDLLEGKGTFTENYEEDAAVTLKMLADQVTELQALRGLVFDCRHSQVRKLLLQAGVRVSPTVLAAKTEAHGGPCAQAG